MNATKSMTIYLAGPIDDISEEDAAGWRAELGKNCPSGCLLFDPSRAFYGAGLGTAREVDYLNKVVIHHSDGVLVNLAGPGRGFGSIREIEFARLHGKPVAVAEGFDKIVSLTVHDLMVAETVDEALLLLIEEIRKTQDAPRGMMFELPDFLTGEVKLRTTMESSGFLDFSGFHQFRIPSVPFSAPIVGNSLRELALAAYHVCKDFYEDETFVVHEMTIELVWPPDERLPKYKGWINAGMPSG